MTSLFDDLLHRAETTSAKLPEAILSEGTALSAKNVLYEKMGANLTDIFRASENLWKSRHITPQAQKAMLFGEKGVSLGEVPVVPLTLQHTSLPSELEDEEALEEDAARVRVEAERAFFNQVLISRPHIAPHASASSSTSFGAGVTPAARFPSVVGNTSSGDRRLRLFGEKVRKYLRSGKKKDLSTLFTEAVRETCTDDAMTDLWNQVVGVVGKRAPADRDDIHTILALLDRSCEYLHNSFADHMRRCVSRNLERAQMGGVPGMKTLIEAFIKSGCTIDTNTEEGSVVDGIPLWQMVFYSFRSGSLEAAKEAVNVLAQNPRSAFLTKALFSLITQPKLDNEVKDKLKTEWRHEQASIRDTFKRAIYSALLGLESPLGDTMENWLWFKLTALRCDSQLTPLLFQEVQKNISIDYGESYFMCGGAADAHLYFTALWLTGQFERAINLLVEVGLLVDAVHMCILCLQNGYLRVTPSTTDVVHGQLLWAEDRREPTKASLSVARLFVGYTKAFEMEDVEMTLDYFYLLKDERTAQGSSVFDSAVSRSLYLTGEVEKIVGRMENGRRTQALIDNYEVDANAVIARVAEDTVVEGNIEQAVDLFHLCGEDDKAIDVESGLLAEAIRAGEGPHLEKAVQRAEKLATAAVNASADRVTTLCTLLDTSILIKLCNKGDVERVQEVLRAIKLIPVEPDQVHAFTTSGHLVSKEVQSILPDVCLLVMKCMVSGMDSARTQADRQRMTKQAQAIVLFAASAQYKFPQHIVSKILTLQVHVQ